MNMSSIASSACGYLPSAVCSLIASRVPTNLAATCAGDQCFAAAVGSSNSSLASAIESCSSVFLTTVTPSTPTLYVTATSTATATNTITQVATSYAVVSAVTSVFDGYTYVVTIDETVSTETDYISAYSKFGKRQDSPCQPGYETSVPNSVGISNSPVDDATAIQTLILPTSTYGSGGMTAPTYAGSRSHLSSMVSERQYLDTTTRLSSGLATVSRLARPEDVTKSSTSSLIGSGSPLLNSTSSGISTSMQPMCSCDVQPSSLLITTISVPVYLSSSTEVGEGATYTESATPGAMASLTITQSTTPTTTELPSIQSSTAIAFPTTVHSPQQVETTTTSIDFTVTVNPLQTATSGSESMHDTTTNVTDVGSSTTSVVNTVSTATLTSIFSRTEDTSSGTSSFEYSADPTQTNTAEHSTMSYGRTSTSGSVHFMSSDLSQSESNSPSSVTSAETHTLVTDTTLLTATINPVQTATTAIATITPSVEVTSSNSFTQSAPYQNTTTVTSILSTNVSQSTTSELSSSSIDVLSSSNLTLGTTTSAASMNVPSIRPETTTFPTTLNPTSSTAGATDTSSQTASQTAMSIGTSSAAVSPVAASSSSANSSVSIASPTNSMATVPASASASSSSITSTTQSTIDSSSIASEVTTSQTATSCGPSAQTSICSCLGVESSIVTASIAPVTMTVPSTTTITLQATVTSIDLLTTTVEVTQAVTTFATATITDFVTSTQLITVNPSTTGCAPFPTATCSSYRNAVFALKASSSETSIDSKYIQLINNDIPESDSGFEEQPAFTADRCLASRFQLTTETYLTGGNGYYANVDPTTQGRYPVFLDDANTISDYGFEYYTCSLLNDGTLSCSADGFTQFAYCAQDQANYGDGLAIANVDSGLDPGCVSVTLSYELISCGS